MTRVCVVKQHTTYDLFTRTGPDLKAIVASSNWRSGPIGLWEAFDAEARVVSEDPAPECQIGKKHWSQYVEGWDLWPSGRSAERADTVDWAQYDLVISIDVSIPTRIVQAFPSVMWCYYFIEGGPAGIEGPFRGSPYHGYNVFLNHRLARTLLSPDAPAVRQMRKTRRAVLDFPYYMQSAHSVRGLYPTLASGSRAGVCLSHHSREACTQRERAALSRFGPVRTEWTSIADIHRAEVESRYFVMHPSSKPTVGVALIEAISAGCLVLAPTDRVLGFPELLDPELDFVGMNDLMELVDALETDPERRERCRRRQELRVDEWCFRNPARNLETLLNAFRASTASAHEQRRAERCARARSAIEVVALRGARRVRRLGEHLSQQRGSPRRRETQD